MGGYLAYTEYKDSGIEWFGEIPSHWKVVKFTHFISFQEGPGIMATDFKDEGVPLLRIANLKPGYVDLEGCNYLDPEKVEKKWKHFRLKSNDLLISCSASTGLVSVVDNSSAGSIGYTGIIRLNPINHKEIDQDFIRILVSSEVFFTQIELLKTGTTIQHYGPIHLRQVIITLPSFSEQRSIARFLDYKTAQIDALITKKETLLKKLAEKRTALISQAVTKGCDRAAPMKDSGIEWLCKIPAHWASGVKLSYLSRIAKHSFVNGPFGSDLLTAELVDEGVPVIYSGDVKPGRFLGKSKKYITEEKAEQLNFCRVDAGDLLLAKVGDPPGDAAVYPKDLPSGIVTQDVVRIKVNRELAIPEYLSLLMNSKAGRYIVQLISVESTRGRFSLEDFKGLRIFVPPVKEQLEIVNVIASLLDPLEQQELKVNQAIKHLKEYRTALITNAVTGKIDVRDVMLELEPVEAA